MMTRVRFVEPQMDPSGTRVVFGGVFVDDKQTSSQVSLRVRLGHPPVLLVDEAPVRGEWVVEREGADGTVRIVATSAVYGLEV